MNLLKDKSFVSFTVKLLIIFAFCYFGSLAVIGLSAPGDYYSSFVDRYLDYITWITNALMKGTEILLSIFGIDTYRAPGFIIRIVNGRGVQIAYDCVGYGVLSFWTAFVLATTNPWRRKLLWLVGGLLLLWLINVIRITLFLLAVNKGWAMPMGIDHHTWFNIAAYIAIFAMIYFYQKAIDPFEGGDDTSSPRQTVSQRQNQ